MIIITTIRIIIMTARLNYENLFENATGSGKMQRHYNKL